MDFLGIGPLELLAILVIALLVLGPNRMVDGARRLGRMWRELQRNLRDLSRSVSIDLEEPPPKRPLPPREQVPPEVKEAHKEPPEDTP